MTTDTPALVFLHAASHTRQMWLPQTEALRGQCRTLAVDLPGHGARREEAFSFAAAVRAVREDMAGAGLDRAVLVGLSLGGCVAVQLAARHPQAVAGLVLSGCTFDPRGLLARLVLTGEGAVFPRGARAFTRAFHRDVARRHPAHAAAMIAAGAYWDAAAVAVRAMRGADFVGALAAYPGPTLILNGARDWAHRTAEGAFAGAARDARVQILAGAGHLANLDRPAAFTDAVRAFAADRKEHAHVHPAPDESLP